MTKKHVYTRDCDGIIHCKICDKYLEINTTTGDLILTKCLGEKEA